MKTVETQITWHMVADGNPDHDGSFLVYRRDWDCADTSNYTVEGGWNTHRDFEGNLFDLHNMPDEKFIAWAEMPDIPKVGGFDE